MKKKLLFIMILFMFVGVLGGCKKHQHTYKLVEEVAATCTEDGKKAYYTCEGCDEIFDENKNSVSEADLVISALGHSLEHHAQVDATCTEDGKKAYYTCEGCDEIFDENKNPVSEADLVIAALDHSLERHAQVDATCTEDGKKAYYTCEGCDEIFDENKNPVSEADLVIAALGHSLEHHAQVDATCTTDGNIEYWTCSVCKKYFSDSEGKNEITVESTVISKHHNIVHHEGQSATCTESGYEAYDTCSECDYTTYQEIPATNHKWSKINYTWAEDYSSCKAVRVCENNSEHEESEQSNSIYEVVNPATCTEAGLGRYTVNFENSVFGTQTHDVVIEATGHNMDHHEAVPTDSCTVIGNVEYWHCDKCDKYFADANGENEFEEGEWLVYTDHVWSDISYTWNEDHSECTAKRVCQVDGTHIETETVTTQLGELESSDCYLYGLVATFTNTAFKSQIYDYFRFTLNSDNMSYTVYKGNHDKEIMVIPGTINNLPVTELGYRAFYYNETIRSITVPKTVIRLGEDSLSYSDYTSIIFEEGSQLQYIGDGALMADYDVQSITLPNTLVSIGESAFCASDFSITFLGTKDQWNAIPKARYWNDGCDGCAAIHCIDGDVDNHYIDDDPIWDDDDDDDFFDDLD